VNGVDALHDVQAERAILGAILLDGAVLSEIQELDASYFYEPANATTFQAMLALRARNEPIDIVTLAAELRSRDRLNAIGGGAYLGALTDEIPTIAHVAEHARIVRTFAYRRIAAQKSLESYQAMLQGDISTAAKLAAAAFEAAARTENSNDPIKLRADTLFKNTFGESGNALLDRLKDRCEGREKPVKTPWTALDDAMGGGLWPGLHFLVGSTGSGKTQFAMQIALKAARDGVPVLYIALELGELDLLARAAEILHPNRDKWSEYFRGEKPVPEEAKDLLKAHNLPFHWIVAPPKGWKHDELEPNVRALRKLHPKASTVLVVVDFAQLLSGTERELRERISSAAYAARAVAREINAAVLMLSSTARERYADLVLQPDQQVGEPYDLVGLGKESGDTEYASDSVMALVRRKWEDKDRPPTGGTRFHLAIAKLRAGTPSWVELCFTGSLFTPPPTGTKVQTVTSIVGIGRGSKQSR
jgi:replicative DNA helicase